MFLPFFLELKRKKVPVSISELLDLIHVLSHYADSNETVSADSFYHMARSTLVKDLKHFDTYDIVFASLFGEIMSDDSKFKSLLNEWLESAKKFELDEQRLKDALNIPPEELICELEKRLKDQKERHDGGNHWIGTGGTSPFGNSGFNPQGIRIGGSGKGRSAIAVAGERNFQSYRHDMVLEVRQIKVALKNLRHLKKVGRPQIDINKTITRTCRNGGDIDLVFESKKKNNLKVLLLMDVGGSMDPYSFRVGRLFSAAHQLNHFKKFKSFYFHNTLYDHLYKGSSLRYSDSVTLDKLYNEYNKETRVVIVGDACMAPYELFSMNGETYHYYSTLQMLKKPNTSPVSIDRWQQFKSKFPKTVWLNPEDPVSWEHPTIKAIDDIFEMFPLTLSGIDKAIKSLKAAQ
ncbi:MAG: VWA domain-containing protein [Bacteriovoracaceae bacterium]|jgi:uncharacterized protein|nr:VWA domain-containing protein [Bacteriovoracaceae bacterium]